MRKPKKAASATRGSVSVFDLVANAVESLEAATPMLRNIKQVTAAQVDQMYRLADRLLMERRTVWQTATTCDDHLRRINQAEMPAIVSAKAPGRRKPQAQTATIRSRIVTAKKPGRRDGDRR